MKQPVGITPITVPTVATMSEDGTVTQVFIDHLVTMTGPVGFEGRHAWMLLSRHQAEALLYGLAEKLHIDVVRNDDEPVA